MKEKKECQLCEYWLEVRTNPNIGDCKCVVSKYYGDVTPKDDSCEKFSKKLKKIFDKTY